MLFLFIIIGIIWSSNKIKAYFKKIDGDRKMKEEPW